MKQTTQLTLEQRVARIESQLAIQQLPIRYALAVDGRDLDGLVSLFVDDVNCGRWGTGREALKKFFAPTLQGFYRSIHQICGHEVDILDDNNATGRVYCRAEHEDGDNWVVMAICYSDTYERRGDNWCFVRRNEQHWYSTDWLQRPGDPRFQNWPGRFTEDKFQPKLPEVFPQWRSYWDQAEPGTVEALTQKP